MGIEEVLLSYHQATNVNCSYGIKCVEALPKTSAEISAVSINGTYIKFCEIIDVENGCGEIYWMLDGDI